MYEAMDSFKPAMRWDLIARQRTRIQAGFYDDTAFLKEFFERSLDDIVGDIVGCPVGDGARFLDVTAQAISRSLGPVVDPALMRKEFSSKGGRGDIDLPVRTESISEYSLWNFWCSRYSIKSIIIETKNLTPEAAVSDIQQSLSYLVTTGLGHFGMVVSRSGFTPPAMEQLESIASGNEFLLLPLDQHDLVQLVRASDEGPSKPMEFLRRKETLLLQAA